MYACLFINEDAYMYVYVYVFRRFGFEKKSVSHFVPASQA